MTNITLTQEQLQEIIAKQVAEALAQATAQTTKQQPQVEQPKDEVANAWKDVMNKSNTFNKRENVQYADEYPISEGMMKFAKDLYKRHQLDVELLKTMSRSQIKAEIDRLRYADIPPSPDQLKLINRTIEEIRLSANHPKCPEELRERGQNLSIPEETLAQLTGGRGGTAGEVIDMLLELNKKYRPYQPITDNQANMIKGWFLCPDVPFEEYGINKKIGNVLMTPEQFLAELKSKLIVQEASQLIQQYMPIVNDWEKTRSTPKQHELIRKLETRMADLSTGQAMTPIVDENGEIKYIKPKGVSKEYNPKAYEFMPEEFLLMMSKDEAEKYIKQLQIELARPKKGAIDNSPHQQLLEDKRSHASHNEVDSRLKEKERIIDFLFKLEAVVGHDNQELRDEVDELLVHGIGSMQGVTAQIQEFIDLALDMHAIKIENLVELAQNSQVISAIIKTSYPKEYDEAVNGKVRDEENNVVKGEPIQSTPKENADVRNFINSLKI